MTPQNDRTASERGVPAPRTEAERRDVTPLPARLHSVDAVLGDAELTPPRKLELLKGWDARQGRARPGGHRRVADAADLGFPDPAPYSPEVQLAIVELYRRHRAELPAPDPTVWAEQGPPPGM